MLAAAAFAVITVWRHANPEPGMGIGFLYVIPISLLAVRYGFSGGYLAAALASALTVFWGETATVEMGGSGYVVRAVAFFSVATVVAWQMRRRGELQGEADRWFSISDELCCVADFEGYFTRVNEAWSRHLGYTEAELLGQPFVAFVHPDDIEKTNAEAAGLGAAGPAATINFENRYRAKDGGWHWLLWSSRSDGTAIYAAARDITERKQLEARLHEIAHHDDLTNLPNRRAWEGRARDELARARRGPHDLAVVMLDLDHLKEVNDSGGHAAGDDLLRAAAGAWSGAIRDVDFLARLGGDEFGLLLPSADSAAADHVVARMRTAAPGVEFSAGVAEVTGDLESAIKRADDALYAAKENARGTTLSAPAPAP